MREHHVESTVSLRPTSNTLVNENRYFTVLLQQNPNKMKKALTFCAFVPSSPTPCPVGGFLSLLTLSFCASRGDAEFHKRFAEGSLVEDGAKVKHLSRCSAILRFRVVADVDACRVSRLGLLPAVVSLLAPLLTRSAFLSSSFRGECPGARNRLVTSHFHCVHVSHKLFLDHELTSDAVYLDALSRGFNVFEVVFLFFSFFSRHC